MNLRKLLEIRIWGKLEESIQDFFFFSTNYFLPSASSFDGSRPVLGAHFLSVSNSIPPSYYYFLNIFLLSIFLLKQKGKKMRIDEKAAKRVLCVWGVICALRLPPPSPRIERRSSNSISCRNTRFDQKSIDVGWVALYTILYNFILFFYYINTLLKLYQVIHYLAGEGGWRFGFAFWEGSDFFIFLMDFIFFWING